MKKGKRHLGKDQTIQIKKHNCKNCVELFWIWIKIEKERTFAVYLARSFFHPPLHMQIYKIYSTLTHGHFVFYTIFFVVLLCGRERESSLTNETSSRQQSRRTSTRVFCSLFSLLSDNSVWATFSIITNRQMQHSNSVSLWPLTFIFWNV